MHRSGHCRPPPGLYGTLGPGGGLTLRNALAAALLLCNGVLGPWALRAVFRGEAERRWALWLRCEPTLVPHVTLRLPHCQSAAAVRMVFLSFLQLSDFWARSAVKDLRSL